MKPKRQWLLTVAALDGADNAKTLRFSTGDYIDRKGNHFLGQLQQPALFRARASGKVLGSPQRAGFGEAVLSNIDRSLDYLVDYAVNGRAVTVELVRELAEIPCFGGLAVENYVRHSDDLSQAVWLRSAVASTSQVAAPDGTATATRFVATAGASDAYCTQDIPTGFVTGGEQVCYSVWLRRNAGASNVLISLYENGALTAAPTVPVTTVWQRFHISKQLLPTTTTLKIQVGGGVTVTNGGSVDVWRAVVADGGSPESGSLKTGATAIYTKPEQLILAATATGLSWQDNTLVLKLRDPYENLLRNHPRTYYGGTNALPAGVDGTANDIKGKPRPRLYGQALQVQPVLVNTTRFIYEVAQEATTVVSAVYDRGVALTNGGAYPDLATLQSTAPAAGQFRAFQGYFRIGTAPTGTISCDASNSASGSAGAVFAQLASDAGYAGASTGTLDTFGAVAVYLKDEVSTAQLLDQLADGVGGYWFLDALGVPRARALSAPASATLFLTRDQIGAVSRSAAGAGSNGLPIWRVVVTADPVDTQTDFAAAAPASYVGRASQAVRRASAESAAVRTRNPLAEEYEVASLLRNLNSAQSAADGLLSILSVRRDRTQVEAFLEPDAVAALTIGTVLNLTINRLSYGAGRNFLVTGFLLDANQRRATLDLWG